MGYESKLYVIRKGGGFPAGLQEKYKYAETLAVYNMCKFPPFVKLFNEDCPPTEYGVYADGNGDDLITEDKYGDFLRERSIREVIEFLEEHLRNTNDNYPRIRPLLAMLKEFENIQNSWYDLAVLHYGY